MSPFLHRCQCMRGFFVLRPCNAAAPYTCPPCARTICSDHWSAKAEPPACHECIARRDEQRALPDDDYDAAWFHGYRHRYYVHYHYQPLFGGTPPLYYDPYDLRSFDSAAAGDAAAAGADSDDDDGRAGGFGDS